MEEYYRFILPAIFFVIYLINQVRKLKQKAKEEKALQPKPVKQIITKQVATNSKDVFDYKGKREIKIRERKSMLSHKKPEVEKKLIVYKPVADEELMAEALLEQRKIENKAMNQERKALTDEHLQPYTAPVKEKLNLDWLKDKANLKKAFIAAEIFQRKY